MVDAAIVMVENAYRHVSEPETSLAYEDQPRAIVGAAKQVARAIFFSLAIIIVSFVPVFLLEAQEGRMFRPLAFTKTSAMVLASLLAITLVPVLMTIFIRGRRLRPESVNPVARFFAWLYEPILRAALRFKWTALLLNFVVVPLTVPLLFVIGSEFMPPLYEGSMLYMPTSPPGMSITEATRLLQVQDKLLKTVPEVEQVFGTVGRDHADGQHTNGDGQYDGGAQAARAVAAGHDFRTTSGRNGCIAPVSRFSERLDATDPQPFGHAPHGHQDTGGNQDLRFRPGHDSGPWTADRADSSAGSRDQKRLRRTGVTGILH
jgi:multidrug efflux pump subunit AcrB